MTISSLPEGTEALMAEIKISEIMWLIERTARWVDPATFRLLPIWYPEHARQALFYKSNWTEPQMNTNRQTGISSHKSEGNVHANKALTLALGLRSDGRKGWSCCHIWGVDDQTYQQANVVVQEPMFFSCVANMILLPTPLKAFTDIVPEVKTILRICARNMYGWQCDHEMMKAVNAELDDWNNWKNYPESWPREKGDNNPIGVMPINPNIRNSASRRWQRIQKDMNSAGPYYPRDSVREVLGYWSLELTAPLGIPGTRHLIP